MQRLIDWTKAYIQYMDAMRKQLISIKEKNNNLLLVEKKSHEEKYFVLENLNQDCLKIKDESHDKKVFFVCLNESKNLNFLIKNWSSFKGHNHFNFVFVNLSKNEKWVINPYMHSLVSDEKSLKQGLMSLYNSCL